MPSARFTELLKTTPAETDIRLLRDAFASAVTALEAQHDGAEATVRKKWGLSSDEPPPTDYLDEDRSVTLAQVFRAEIESHRHYLGAAVEELRIASIVALFHALERVTNAMRGKSKYDHGAAMKRLRELDREPQEETLCTLQLFANAAKHGEGSSAKRLREVRPDLIQKSKVVGKPQTVTIFYDSVLASLRIRS